ncbi:hypothetical protein CYFUS_000197 [Cystobacter fuscus]|uniref:Uncharacterized protein n=1 Tax=Cystobacter fuscus TaxID=43 RepID=A0A250IU69_9BACT|nr:hypothetical protein [Cystobacter fuscus]ATB34790.1 hypothetical protein CYFUS_000197 [Cystobacter fuscus]
MARLFPEREDKEERQSTKCRSAVWDNDYLTVVLKSKAPNIWMFSLDMNS